jgi:uncharacterized protein with HEPN domain
MLFSIGVTVQAADTTNTYSNLKVVSSAYPSRNLQYTYESYVNYPDLVHYITGGPVHKWESTEIFNEWNFVPTGEEGVYFIESAFVKNTRLAIVDEMGNSFQVPTGHKPVVTVPKAWGTVDSTPAQWRIWPQDDDTYIIQSLYASNYFLGIAPYNSEYYQPDTNTYIGETTKIYAINSKLQNLGPATKWIIEDFSAFDDPDAVTWEQIQDMYYGLDYLQGALANAGALWGVDQKEINFNNSLADLLTSLDALGANVSYNIPWSSSTDTSNNSISLNDRLDRISFALWNFKSNIYALVTDPTKLAKLDGLMTQYNRKAENYFEQGIRTIASDILVLDNVVSKKSIERTIQALACMVAALHTGWYSDRKSVV